MNARARIAVAFAVALAAALGYAATSAAAGAKRVRIAETQCISKGGIGAVNGSIYIVLRSDKNELQLAHERWSGRPASEHQAVFVSRDGAKLLDPADPATTVSESVLISFEGTKVLFYDFAEGTGCHYLRTAP